MEKHITTGITSTSTEIHYYSDTILQRPAPVEILHPVGDPQRFYLLRHCFFHKKSAQITFMCTDVRKCEKMLSSSFADLEQCQKVLSSKCSVLP